MTLVIDSTGTMLPAHHCYLVPDEAFTPEEWDDIEGFSDTEIARIGRENGVSVEKSEQLLQAIADALWGDGADAEWNADTLDTIAGAIRHQRPELITARGGDQ
jgi:hypothetical protein